MDPNKECKNLSEVFALVEDQLLHLRTLQQKQSALFAAASAAGETVEARVDTRGREAEVRLDESSLADEASVNGMLARDHVSASRGAQP